MLMERSIDGPVLHLRMAHGKASALDLDLCQALQREFEAAAEAEGIRAIVLTGTASIFSAGVDLPRLVDSGDGYVQEFVESLDSMLRSLFLFPKPALAAVNGHAIAGGAILAFACDYRLMSAGRIGVPELLVGVPFPPLAASVVRFAIPPQHLQSMIYLARTVEAAEAKSMGIIDEVVSAEDLMPRAGELARQLAAVPADAFRITKRQFREPFLHDASRMAGASADEIDAVWRDKRVHDHIRRYMARTFK